MSRLFWQKEDRPSLAALGWEQQACLGSAATWDEARQLLPDASHEVLIALHGIRLDEIPKLSIQETGLPAWGNGIR